MKQIWLVAWLMAGLIPIADAGSSVSGATILQLAINKAYGNFVFIRIDLTPTAAPPCANGSWQYTLTLSNPGDSQMYALLLTAYAQGKQVHIDGSGVCSEFSQSESVLDLQVQ